MRPKDRPRLSVRATVAVALAALVVPMLALPAVAETKPSSWVPWILDGADQFRLDRPPGARSVKTKRELRRVRRMQASITPKIRRQIASWDRVPPVVRWSDTALSMIQRHRPRVAPASRTLALLENAMFDALIAAHDSKQAFRRPAPYRMDSRIKKLASARGSSYPSIPAVIAGAAEEVLTQLFPQESPETFRLKARRAVRTRLFAGVNYPSDVRKGRALGRAVAQEVLLQRSSDGHTNTGFSKERPEGDAYWEPTPPGLEAPVGGPVGTWMPWATPDPATVRVASGISGPFTYGSPEFMAELQEVVDGQRDLTEEQAQIAIFWDDGPGSYTPPGHWLQIALDLIKENRVGERAATRILSYVATAEADSAIAYFEAKYEWWSIRPITAVRRLCDEGARLCSPTELEADPSLATYPDWFPHLITPNFPSYPSGHSTFSGAAAAVLGHFFPSSAELLDGMADEAALSRFYGGIHFTSDNDDGLILGRQVASYVLQRASADGSGP